MARATHRDVFSREERIALMSRIRGKNTAPEIALRKALFAIGLRYRLHSKNVPGRPDIVFPRQRAVVLLNGCFWHGQGCHLFRWPRSNVAFWKTKIEGNRRRDERVRQQLAGAGWRSITVWECSIRRASSARVLSVASTVARRIVT